MRWRHDGPPSTAILDLLALPHALEALVKDIDLRPVVVCSRSLHDHQTLVLSAPKRRRTRHDPPVASAVASKYGRCLEHRIGNLYAVLPIMAGNRHADRIRGKTNRRRFSGYRRSVTQLVSPPFPLLIRNIVIPYAPVPARASSTSRAISAVVAASHGSSAQCSMSILLTHPAASTRKTRIAFVSFRIVYLFLSHAAAGILRPLPIAPRKSTP